MPRELPRVLVLTGTVAFPRLLEALPGLLVAGVAREVRVQSADPPPRAEGLLALGRLPREALSGELDAADVVVSHGGSGSCLEAVARGHVPVVVARRAALGESVDDHQEDLVRALLARGLAVRPEDPLGRALVEAVRAATGRRGPPRPPRGIAAYLRRAFDALAGRPRGRGAPLRVEAVARGTYEAALAGLDLVSPLQTTAWGIARGTQGWRSGWVLARDAHGRAVAAAQTLRRWPGAPPYLPYGPSVVATPDGARGARAILLHLARRRPAGLLWAPAWFHATHGVTSGPGTRPLAPPSRTGLLDLEADEDALRAGLRGTWRRDLEKAERDPDVTIAHEDPAAVVGDLLAEVTTLADRRGFRAPLPPALGRRFAQECAARGGGLLAVVARAGDVVLSRYLVAVHGRLAQTLWTAGSPDPRSPGAGRRALLAAIGRARACGATTYDLAGIDDEGNPGVATFKRGLSPRIVEVPGLAWCPPAFVPPALAGIGPAPHRPRRRQPSSAPRPATPTTRTPSSRS